MSTVRARDACSRGTGWTDRRNSGGLVASTPEWGTRGEIFLPLTGGSDQTSSGYSRGVNNTLEMTERLPDPGVPSLHPLTVRRTSYRPDLVIVTVVGDLDASTTGALERVLWDEVSPRLVIDLSGVESMTEAGAAVVARAANRARIEHRGLGIVVTRRAVAQALAGAHVGLQFLCFPTLSDAVREIPAPTWS